MQSKRWVGKQENCSNEINIFELSIHFQNIRYFNMLGEREHMSSSDNLVVYYDRISSFSALSGYNGYY